jgi:hypothetical protein
MSVQSPITFSGTLAYPVDDGQPNCEVVVALSALFEHQATYKFEFTVAGSKSVDFGTLAVSGAKVILVEVLPDTSPAAQPVTLTINGGTDAMQLSPGGAWVYINPNPSSGGVLSMDLAHTSAATVRVRIFG